MNKCGEISEKNEILAAQLGAQIKIGMAGWFNIGGTKLSCMGTCVLGNGLEDHCAEVDVTLPHKETVQ